ncbi:hypothetical protein EC968_002488 [Mortierella alpina]|nr:hypothetical protein EC968_002488 [Mortierella alpina]
MTGQSQALGAPAQAIETSVQVALRIRPIVTDAKNRHRPRAEAEVLSLVERSPTPSLSSPGSGTTSGQQQHDQPQQVVVVPLQRHFTFDHIFGTGASQEEVYQGSVKRMVDKFMEGYNVTIMAYGQTSSGKTYTMGTAAPSSEDRGSSSEGIIPRAMNQLFQEAKRPPPLYPGYKVPPLKTTFRVSFVEIYNEDLIDLLAKGEFRPPVTIREDAKGNIYWTGVQEIVVTSVEEVIHLLWFGSQNRQTHSTEMNEKSSRSHAIFSITLRQEKFVPTHPPPVQPPSSASSAAAPQSDVQNSPTLRRTHVPSPSIGGLSQTGNTANGRPGTPTSSGSGIPAPFTSGIVAPGSKLKRHSTMLDVVPSTPSATAAVPASDEPEPEGEWIVLNSKFHFVDLAGSERLKRTSAIGDRAKEGISINAGLHALGNVISALGDPSKKASHNTLKYANRARNIKNSSSLNQELNMDNPEYLRSIIQKLKLEIRLLKEAKASKTGTGLASSADEATEKGLYSNRNSMIAAPSGRPSEDNPVDDRTLSPSPSRRLSHHHSRDSIATDISHGHLDSVVEEDDRYSDISSSTRTVVASSTNGTGTTASSTSTSLTTAGSRPAVPPILIPPSQDFIDEYAKVISELESHLAMTQAALNHSEQILEEQQARIDVIEDENRMLLQKQKEKANKGDDVWLQQEQQQQQYHDLKQVLAKVQEQLKEVETRKTESERHVQELEEKLAKERATAEENINRIKMEQALHVTESARDRSRSASPSPSAQMDKAIAIKTAELKELSERVVDLEEQCRLHQAQVEAEAEALRQLQAAREATEDSIPSPTATDDGSDADEARREEDLIEKLQAKATLEKELESERKRLKDLTAEVELAKLASHVRTDSALEDTAEDQIKHLAISPPLSESIRIQELETELKNARESEQLLRAETTTLTERLEKLQKEYAAAQEAEEMLHLAVSDLEGRLQSSQEKETKHQEELEQQLARIQDLELRSTNAEREALELAEQLTSKLTEAKAAAEERLADQLLELLEKMEQERSKVEILQTEVENHLAALATEKTRASELETDRDAIRNQWDADKERIHALEKQIEDQTAQVLEKAALIVSLEERVSQHEGALEAKLMLEQELDRRVAEHDQALESKIALIQELESKVLQLESSAGDSSPDMKTLLAKVQDDLSTALEQLEVSQAKVQDQERALGEMKEQLSTLELEANAAKDALTNRDAEHAVAIQALEAKVKLAEADRDDAETMFEDAERRHQAVDDEIRTLKSHVAQHLATIESLQVQLIEAQQTPPSSRPTSISSAAAAVVGPGEDPMPVIQRLEKEKARYRALVRENEKEIERLSLDLESLASEFSNAATTFEDAEEEMKARIAELESALEERNISMVNIKAKNLSSTSLASSIASTFSARNRDSAALHPSSAAAVVGAATPSKAQLLSLKAERDQAVESSEKLSLIVAELNEQNHSLQERLLNLEKEQESMKLQHVLERQAQQEELRAIRERAERLDRNANSPSPIGHHHQTRVHEDEEKVSGVFDRGLRHHSSISSDHFAGIGRGEDSLATPRQSWSTVASTSQPNSQPGSQIRAGRQESTLIQQAKQIKQLEERIAELQAYGGAPMSPQEGPNGHHRIASTASVSGVGPVGLGIQHKSSDQDLSSARPPMVRQPSNADKLSSSALRALGAFGPSGNNAPPTPPPTAPLPPPPVGAPPSLKNSAVAHLSNDAATSPSTSPHIRPSRTSRASSASTTAAAAAAASAASRRDKRDSNASNSSEAQIISSNGGLHNGVSSNGWASPTNSMMSVGTISAATAQALQGVEVDELRGVVDTLAHQVQALKVEQTMQQGKIHRLEAALADTEERLKHAHEGRAALLKEKEALTKELESVRGELTASKIKSEKDRAGLEGIVERERKEREKAVETRAIMEARMEELMGRRSKFACF